MDGKFISILVLLGIVAFLTGAVVEENEIHKHKYDTPSKTRGGVQDITLPYADWLEIADTELNAAISFKPIEKRAKNVIIFLGDGFGFTTVTGARYLKAEKENLMPHNAKLAWDTLPISGTSKTYNADMKTPDSAGSATAIMCGEKTRFGVLGVNDKVERYKCDQFTEENKMKSLLKRAMDIGKWGGIVTNKRLTDATPASTYASTPNRFWEFEVPVDDPCHGKVEDLAHQLVLGGYGNGFKVVLGGGKLRFLPETEVDDESGKPGERKDGLNLINEWSRLKAEAGISQEKYKFVDRKSDFDAIDPHNTDYLLGIFQDADMNYEVDRVDDIYGEPSTLDMTEKAIKLLERSENGYFLLVENGLIDMAHHANKARKSLEEALMFDKAVAKALELTNPEETLIIVTADHSHLFTVGAYSWIGNSIFGWVVTQHGDVQWSRDNKPEMFLHYANGPGWLEHRSATGDWGNETLRKNVSDLLDSGETASKDYTYDGQDPRHSESHGAEDVPIYAQGPMSHLLTGTHEQMYIAHVAMYAACIGPYHTRDHCNSTVDSYPSSGFSINNSTCIMRLTFIYCILQLIPKLIQ